MKEGDYRSERERVIVLGALRCSEEERESWLVKKCEGDENLLESVRATLAEEEQPTLVASSAETFKGNRIESGMRIGHYTILEPIGEGGFAEVFLANQKEPVRRRVAIKVLKQGMDSREVLARFEAERQALAMMKHPNIAQVLDAGITDNGRSWFAMEYVERGTPVTDYCDKKKLKLILIPKLKKIKKKKLQKKPILRKKETKL